MPKRKNQVSLKEDTCRQTGLSLRSLLAGASFQIRSPQVLLASLGLIVAASGGIGGGGILVPLFMLALALTGRVRVACVACAARAQRVRGWMGIGSRTLGQCFLGATEHLLSSVADERTVLYRFDRRGHARLRKCVSVIICCLLLRPYSGGNFSRRPEFRGWGGVQVGARLGWGADG